MTDPDDIGDALAHQLTRRLKALREPRMQQAVMAEVLVAQPAEHAAAMLRTLLVRAVQRDDPHARAAVDCLVACLGTCATDAGIEYPTRAALYAAAREAGAPAVANLFFDASPATAREAVVSAQFEPERPVVPDGRALTLGERRALARGHRRDLLEHLVRDPHPAVVGVLLDNPHLTEADVVRIAASRPAVPEALALIAASPRWRPRYAVKRALVKNPHTPVHLALRLCASLRATDLRAVGADANLPGPVREQADELLCQRR